MAGLGTTLCCKHTISPPTHNSQANRALQIFFFFTVCVNYKNQVDCIIVGVCSLFDDRGTWETTFTIMYTNMELHEPIYLKKRVLANFIS